MNYAGDIPKEHLELLEELIELEKWFDDYGSGIPILDVAKGLVCIAHDYYCMDMEEEGERLLKLVEKRCPGYFTSPIFVHIIKDRDFAYLIKNLKKSLAINLMISLGFNDE